MCLMPYALLSRVWSLSLVLLQHSSKWYSRLHQYLNQLPDKGVSIFAHDYELPDNLDTLVNMKNINKEGRFEWTQKLSLDVDSILVEDDEGELCESILKYVNNINKTSSKTAKSEKPDLQMTLPVEDKVVENIRQPMKNTQKVNNDQGEVISREMFNKLYKKNTTETNPVQKEKKIINHDIDNIVDRNSLQAFIKAEEEFRNNSDEKSLTTHLSFMQWQALKTALLNLDNPLIMSDKLERKTKKIWQKKCLDYK
ncbi:unnamed protein product [Danaus chrysippus]|uniref:(African queen) hypothetical protein n=1 Tax=Danaus chrysippus TaxID=151541 RepID=A0A8J2WAV5_9NEOP|nr:unnamed protein product [Danaus chrysippus]